MLNNRGNYQQHGFVPPSPSSSTSNASRCCAWRRPCIPDSHQRGRRLWLCCCCYCSSSSNSLFTSLGVFILVLIYTLLGALIFMLLEGISKDTSAHISRKSNDEIRAETVEKLWSITEDLNILYKENWTRLAADEVYKFQEALLKRLQTHSDPMKYSTTHYQWTFASSYLYSLTLITTIGFGSVAPSTTWSKLVTVLYSVVGIPLMLIYLSTTGEILSRNFRSVYASVCIRKAVKRKKPPESKTYMSTGSYAHKGLNHVADGKIPCGSSDDNFKVDRVVYENENRNRSCHQAPPQIPAPIFISLLLISVYIFAGAYLFHYLESWTYLDGSLFCFTSLTTIGFGDLTPGTRAALKSKGKAVSEMTSVTTTSCYILFGMALIAMCFNLIQDQIVTILKKFSGLFGGTHEFIEDQPEFEAVSMSVVSSSAS